MNPVVSIVTLNWNRRQDVLRTLFSIYSQTYEPKEIIVVDNGSSDQSVNAIQSGFPQTKIIALSQNKGVEGYNVGMEAASGEFILLIDNDMDLLQNDTVQHVVAAFAQNPKLGAVALQVRNPDQTLSPNNPKFWNEKGDDERGYACSTFDGGGVALRKSLLKQTGYYLPEFFVYHSEVDLSTRIWDSGFEIRYFPGIAVTHRESPVSRNVAMQTFYTTRNYLWYVWIYYPFSMKVFETFHFLQRSFIQNVRRGRPLGAWFRGVGAAIFKWHTISHRRKSAKAETLRWMQQLRDKDREQKEGA